MPDSRGGWRTRAARAWQAIWAYERAVSSRWADDIGPATWRVAVRRVAWPLLAAASGALLGYPWSWPVGSLVGAAVVIVWLILWSRLTSAARLHAELVAENDHFRRLGDDLEKIRELRIAAESATGYYAFPDPLHPVPAGAITLSDFRLLYEELRGHKAIYDAAYKLEGLLRLCLSDAGTGADHEDFARRAERACAEMVAACNELIHPSREGTTR